MWALCKSDVEHICSNIKKWNVSKAKVDFEAFANEVKTVMDKYLGSGIGRDPSGRPVNVADMLGEVIFKIGDYGIVLRGDVASNLCTICISKGLIRQLDPGFDIVTSSLPYFWRYETMYRPEETKVWLEDEASNLSKNVKPNTRLQLAT